MFAKELPVGWPKGKKLAVSVNIMCEAWTDDAAPGIGPMGNPLKPGFLDTQARSWAEYGINIGAHRLLDIIGEAGVPCGTYASGIIAEKWPELLKRIDREGHFIGAHSWMQNTLPVYLEPEDEAAQLKRGVELFSDVIGKRPEGFASPRGTPSAHTCELLVENGFKWHIDHFNSDLPYLMETKKGPLAIVPFTMEVNDLPLYMRFGNPPEVFSQTLRRIVENYSEIGSPPAVLDITAHAHVFGRPFGAIEIKAAIDIVKNVDWIWMTTHQELAELVYPK
ncbi:MAG: polysaccharide deacetylase family protein [Alphaproteobacteria bacterium]|nr:polysaccharide deacetylase family protein [Alphaproteobacteria bacterium]|tara:strand:+ start:551 stop:1387 length:837 start_codon:yes stop_codon:yes gene_type:complete